MQFKTSHFYRLFIALLLAVCCKANGQQPMVEINSKSNDSGGSIKVAIIIDDLGYNRKAGEKALSLPGAFSYAVIPFTPFGRDLAEQAFFSEKDVLLHLPMESIGGSKLGRGGITSKQNETQVKQSFHKALNALPFVVGFNNHMGSLLTTKNKFMNWIMEEAAATPLFFIDSMTNAKSIAQQAASDHSIPSMKRDVFIDASPNPRKIKKQFRRLINIAKETGTAIGIAHPYPNTLDFLEKHISSLEKAGIKLVGIAELIREIPPQATATLPQQDIIHYIANLPIPD